MPASTTASKKAKGRNLQKLVRDKLRELFKGVLADDDITSTSMGVGGMDIGLSPAAKRVIPYAFECKAQEGMGKLYGFWDQAKANSKDLTPALVIRSNRKEALVVLKLDDFLRLI